MAKLKTLTLGMLTTLVFASVGFLSLRRAALVCAHAPGAPGICQIVVQASHGEEERFPGTFGDVQTRLLPSTKARAPERWTVALLDERGAQRTFGAYATRADADALAARVRAFVSDSNASPFVVAEDHWLQPFVWFLIAVMVAAWTARELMRTPAAEASPPPVATGGLSVRTIVLLVGSLVALSTAAQWFITRHANEKQGWLEFEVESRCEFGGLEMLPGAASRQSIDPGRYCVRIFDPSVSGHWQTQCFDIAIGKTTVVRCRPQRP
jgi:hypothetical protein